MEQAKNNKVLVVVDMQNDFITGSLGSKEAQAVRGTVVKRILDFDGLILYTLDTHTEDYLNTKRGKSCRFRTALRARMAGRQIPPSGWR